MINNSSGRSTGPKPARAAGSLIIALAAAVTLSACATSISTLAGNRASEAIPIEEPLSALAFAPVAGPPRPVADALARSFANAAVARKLTLAPYRRRTSAYVVKGFMSVSTGENGTMTVYVWNVLSPDLKRLHRISGQVTDEAVAGDPWTALSQKTLDTIADTTLDQLALWMASLE